MRRQRTTTEVASHVVNFRRLGGIAPVGPDGSIKAYTSSDLRTRLAGMRVQLTRGRKFAALLPIVVALAAWFVIPSYAAAPHARVTTAVHHAAPAVAPGVVPAVAPPVSNSDGSISVGPVASAPVTGAGDGLLRTSFVGVALLVAGLVIFTAPRRNPHAEAVWAETHRPTPVVG